MPAKMMEIQTDTDSQKGALFPRVHVSETRISGPRAPPRNKMALFEQFTIPPHRFVPPPLQENSHQGMSSGINSCFVNPKQVKVRQLKSQDINVSCGKEKSEVSRRSVAELCSYSRTSAAFDSSDKDCSSLPSKHASQLSPTNSQLKKAWDGSTAESATVYCTHRRGSPTDVQIQHSTAESGHITSSKERMGSSYVDFEGIEAFDTALDFAIAENGIDNTNFLVGSAACNNRSAVVSPPKRRTVQPAERDTDGCIHECDVGDGATSIMQPIVCTNEEYHSDRSSEVAGRMGQQQHPMSLENCDLDRRSPDFSPRIIPKHVIGLIGQREFWEARKTILQQQKTLSLQVFELHRLVEVQRLIAAMPRLLLEENGKSVVLKDLTQPGLVKVSKELLSKELLNKEAKHCATQKRAAVKEPKKLTKLSSGVGLTKGHNQHQRPSLKMLVSESVRVSNNQNRVRTWGFIPTPFVENQWLNAGSHNYGLCRTGLTPSGSSSTLVTGLGPMALQSPMVGHWYNGQQVWQSNPNVLTDWNMPCNIWHKDIPEFSNPPLASQKMANGNFIQKFDYASSTQATGGVPMQNKVIPMLRKPASPTLNPSASAQVSKLIGNSQQLACTIEKGRSPHQNKLGFQPTKSAGDLHVPDKTKLASLAGPCGIPSERSGLGFQKYSSMVSTRGDVIVQSTRLKDMHSSTESCVNDMFFPLKSVSSVQVGEENGFGSPSSSKVIRAVPHPASASVQAAAKILKAIQQNE